MASAPLFLIPHPYWVVYKHSNMVRSCLDSQICVPCSSVLLIKELLQVATLEESVVSSLSFKNLHLAHLQHASAGDCVDGLLCKMRVKQIYNCKMQIANVETDEYIL